jgi:5S rRNA maturation endonuclease (ribonuclease M5)
VVAGSNPVEPTFSNMKPILDLEDWISKLKHSNKLILVEGKKDRAALNSLGIKNIIIINKPLFEVVEKIADSVTECILLTDLDPAGKKLYSYISRNLKRRGIKIDDRFRLYLYKNTKLRNIEGIRNYL